MKRLALLLLLFWSTVCFAQYNGPKPILGEQIDWSHPLSRGLVGYWPLPEGGGTLVNDLSGNGNTGTITGATWSAGKFGPCLRFGGLNNEVDCGTCGDAFLTESGPVTVTAWINPVSLGENSAGKIVDRSVGTTGPGLFIVGTNQLAFYVDGATDLRRLSQNNMITLSSWQFVAATWTGELAAATVVIYLNGQALTSYATSQNMLTPVDNSTAHLIIGDNDASSRCFDGLIDNVQIYNRALTADEIQKLYYDPFGMFPGLRADWYVTSGAAPTYRRRVIIAALPFTPPVAVIGMLAWMLSRKKRG